MFTGDNVLTAISVAKECGILMGEERVVNLQADTSGTTPVIYCESTLHGVSIFMLSYLKSNTSLLLSHSWTQVRPIVYLLLVLITTLAQDWLLSYEKKFC